MTEQQKEIEKMKDQIRSLRISLLVLDIGLVVLAICFSYRCSKIQNSLSGIVRCLQLENLIHQLLLSMH